MNVVASIDLRTRMCDVRDQGARPTCLAHALTAAHEHAAAMAEPLSPEYLHYLATGGRICDAAQVYSAIEALKNTGQCTEQDCPYSVSDPPLTWKPPTGLVLRRFPFTVPPNPLVMLEQQLTHGVAPVLGLSLPTTFYTPTEPWVISTDYTVRTNHAVVGVGLGAYRGDPVYLIRNSWGASWGMQGYAWLDAAFMRQHLFDILIPRRATP